MNADPDDYDKSSDDDCEIRVECPYCDGDGESSCAIGGGTITVDCPECGGTGWF